MEKKLHVKKVDYFDITIEGNAEEAFALLSTFSAIGIGLLAFRATPTNKGKARFSLFPNDGTKMIDGARKAGIHLEGPYAALIITSDSDEPGECADIFRRLSQQGIHDFEACGIADIKGSYGVVLYMSGEDCDKAWAVLNA
ncbi:MAG TPA: hypothetical protein PLK12_17670 [Prolixibacteraceae bacterium]|nr:hypothetical protein [Prolixibacteraceae bacterium]